MSAPTPTPAPPLPLSGFARLHTQDVDQARHVVAEAFCPHRLTALDRADGFETRFHAAPTGRVSLCYLDYGGRVHITPFEQRGFYLVLIPLAGHAELRFGREAAYYDRDGAGVPPLDRTYDIHVSAGSPHLVLWISRSQLEGQLRSMLAGPVVDPVRFALGMDTTTPAVRSWRRVVNLLLDEVDGDGAILGEPLALRELERLLLGRLLLAQPNNYSAALHAGPRSVAPRAIRYAVELIEAHAAEPLTVEDVAEATGMSVRTLQEGFRRFLGTTPTSYLREVRLRRVQAELAAADPVGTTVTKVALHWGFLHPGRFAAQYHERFGESPSTTLRS